MEIKNSAILEVITRMNNAAPSYIYGGFLRDTLLDLRPFDVDIATSLSMAEIQHIFPSFRASANGTLLGAGHFRRHHWTFELSLLNGDDIQVFMRSKDFTVNSIYHDGQTLFDYYGGGRDLMERIIRPLDPPEIHFTRNPQAYLRAIRLCGQLGFSLEQELLDYLLQNPEHFLENHVGRIQQEGYRILRSPYLLNACKTLNELELLSFDTEMLNQAGPMKLVPAKEQNHLCRLLLLIIYIGLPATHQFIERFLLSKQLKQQLDYYAPFLDDQAVIDNPTVLNMVLNVKRIQYADDVERLQSYMERIRNR